MPMTTELYMALLSMDSYNRGYGQRLDVVAAGASNTQIGNATIGTDALPSGAISAGFFAQSYTLNGQKIISYRGTDQVITPPWSDSPGSDLWNGYGTAFGLPFNDQARMAADFFQTVTGTQTTDPSTGNAILTGHSLGGGLAGFIGSIYRQHKNRGRFPLFFDFAPSQLLAHRLRAVMERAGDMILVLDRGFLLL